MAKERSFAKVNGTDVATNAAPDKTIFAAPATGSLRLCRGSISVLVAAVGGGGEAVLEDGLNGTKILRVAAPTTREFAFDFGDDGYPLTAMTLLNLTVEGAVTTQATAQCTAVGFIQT